MDFEFDVFLSHSSEDKLAVRELAQRLRAEGLSVWFDEWVIEPGDMISLKIEHGLQQSRTLVLVMSANAFASEWVNLERHTALFRDPTNTHRRFIPLRIDDAEIRDVLRQFAYIDWRKPSDSEFMRLLSACRNGRRDSTPAPVSTSGSFKDAHEAPVAKARAIRRPEPSSEPWLTLSVDAGRNSNTMEIQPEITDAQVNDALVKIRKRFPSARKYSPAPVSVAQIFFPPSIAEARTIDELFPTPRPVQAADTHSIERLAVDNAFRNASDTQIAQYNSELESWYLSSERHLRQEIPRFNALRRTALIVLHLNNIGRAPVTDIDVFIPVPDGLKLSTQLPSVNRLTNPPLKPTDYTNLFAQSLGQILGSNLPANPPTTPVSDHMETPNVVGPKWIRGTPLQLTFHVGKLKRGTSVQLGTVFVTFPANTPSRVALHWRINAWELTNDDLGQLTLEARYGVERPLDVSAIIPNST